jgi:hypothetical protein
MEGRRGIGHWWGEKGRHAREKRNRGEREVEFSQGLMRNFRKLQGLVCKAKFSIDLKSK